MSAEWYVDHYTMVQNIQRLFASSIRFRILSVRRPDPIVRQAYGRFMPFFQQDGLQMRCWWCASSRDNRRPLASRIRVPNRHPIGRKNTDNLQFMSFFGWGFLFALSRVLLVGHLSGCRVNFNAKNLLLEWFQYYYEGCRICLSH